MKVALLLYGTLNTHGLINDASSSYRSVPKELLKLHWQGRIKLDVFVYTEDKNFFKWTPAERMKRDHIHGFPLIEWVEDRYAVCQYDAADIRASLKSIYGTCLKGVTILEDAYDPKEWASSKEDYRVPGSTNSWRNTMIMTFLSKKRHVFELAKMFGEYDCYAICRPDSELRVAKNQPDVSEILFGVLQGLAQEEEAAACFDLTSSNHETLRFETGLGMMKNDDFYANTAGMEAKVSLVDYIRNTYEGNFFSAYEDPVYRCSSCYHVGELKSGARYCSHCNSKDLKDVTEWPEYKMFRHVTDKVRKLSYVPMTCTVVR